VQDLAIVGVPDRERGELVKAVVVSSKETPFDRQVFDAYAREHLSIHKRPLAVEICEGDLPRNFLGKVYRRKLRGNGAPSPTPLGAGEAADPAA
jgi:long-chain acyl-CoA synthetase